MEAMDDIRKILGIKPYQESDFDFFRGASTALIGCAAGLLFLGVMVRSDDMIVSGVCLTLMGILSVGNALLIRRRLRGSSSKPIEA
ncbi:MAG: hypothetical protein WC083_07990 [Candidatus Methanomethylophilaceae archaeon]|jgi:hypothetical protein